jgi:hypothetical protein
MPDEKSLKSPAPAHSSSAFSYPVVKGPRDKPDLETAVAKNRLDSEIALLRLTIARLQEKDPANFPALLQSVHVMAELVKIQDTLQDDKTDNLGESIRNVIREIGGPLGLVLLKDIHKEEKDVI